LCFSKRRFLPTFFQQRQLVYLVFCLPAFDGFDVEGITPTRVQTYTTLYCVLLVPLPLALTIRGRPVRVELVHVTPGFRWELIAHNPGRVGY
jgi:hypothetical protein